MSDLIKALSILVKYGDHYSPTHCGHDKLTIADINPGDVSEEDRAELDRLGFIVSTQHGEEAFVSYRFGSA